MDQNLRINNNNETAKDAENLIPVRQRIGIKAEADDSDKIEACGPPIEPIKERWIYDSASCLQMGMSSMMRKKTVDGVDAVITGSPAIAVAAAAATGSSTNPVDAAPLDLSVKSGAAESCLISAALAPRSLPQQKQQQHQKQKQ